MRLLQINCNANWGSTGRIAEQIGLLALKQGWESYIAYGRDCNESSSMLIRVGSLLNPYLHYAANKIFDKEGLASSHATNQLVDVIKELKPDIIHLHNIHDHWLNYPILFSYLKTLDIPIVWTQHDCWAFTGGCCYYSLAGCQQWKSECKKCPVRRSLFIDLSTKQFSHKKKYFNNIHNLTIVPVSKWLSNEISYSFLRVHKKQIIFNGVDTNSFSIKDSFFIRDKYNIGNINYYLAAATMWSERKGLSDYIRLASYLRDNEKLVLVGLSKQQSKGVPSNVIAIPRTQDVDELVALYNEAAIVLNLSYEETFGLTTAEGFACGTPGIVYNCTASPELITPETGRIVESGDVKGVYAAIREVTSIGKEKMSIACRNRAIEKYDKDKNFKQYISLYESLLK